MRKDIRSRLSAYERTIQTFIDISKETGKTHKALGKLMREYENYRDCNTDVVTVVISSNLCNENVGEFTTEKPRRYEEIMEQARQGRELISKANQSVSDCIVEDKVCVINPILRSTFSVLVDLKAYTENVVILPVNSKTRVEEVIVSIKEWQRSSNNPSYPVVLLMLSEAEDLSGLVADIADTHEIPIHYSNL